MRQMFKTQVITLPSKVCRVLTWLAYTIESPLLKGVILIYTVGNDVR